MKVIKLSVVIGMLWLLMSGCEKEKNSFLHQADQDVWLVDTEDILHFGAEKDKIKSIDTPAFLPIRDVRLDDDALVYAFHHAGVTKVYPLSVMGQHEIVNDRISAFYYAVSYCPRTESALVWNRQINGAVTEFGVSGMLYKENLIPYDRNTMSHWSQMKNICINGPLIGAQPESSLLIQTTFGLIKNAYPDALVIDHTDCAEGSCGTDGRDAGDPGTEDIIILPPEAQYYGVLDGDNLLLFELELFKDSIRVIETRFGNLNLVMVGSFEKNLFIAFLRNNLTGITSFQSVQEKLPVVMRDNLGNEYDIFGNIVQGPDKGERLSSPVAYLAQTFAWQTLFGNMKVYE